jgi:hypothetical protein
MTFPGGRAKVRALPDCPQSSNSTYPVLNFCVSAGADIGFGAATTVRSTTINSSGCWTLAIGAATSANTAATRQRPRANNVRNEPAVMVLPVSCEDGRPHERERCVSDASAHLDREARRNRRFFVVHLLSGELSRCVDCRVTRASCRRRSRPSRERSGMRPPTSRGPSRLRP